MLRLRAPVASGLQPADTAAPAAVGVDMKAGIIRGASAMQAVEALGHDCTADQVTLRMVAELGNAAEQGVKVRFTHPGLCGDGMGSYLGRMRDFRVAGDKVIGDIHLSDAAAASPEGNLRDYVLQLAQEDPGAFGMSVVVDATQVWSLADGTEIPADGPAPEGVVGELPRLRPLALFAVDVVDEPAANRDGMFGRGAALLALARGTNPDAAEAFAALDRIREQLGWPAEKAQALLAAYLAARRPAVVPLTLARARELGKDKPQHLEALLDAVAGGRSEAEVLASIEAQLHAQLAAKSEALLAKYTTDRIAQEAELAALRQAHALEMAALRERVAKAEKLAGLAVSAPADPGLGNAATDLPSFTRADAAAGKIPSALLTSGAYALTA
jgi:hypothetical protein